MADLFAWFDTVAVYLIQFFSRCLIVPGYYLWFCLRVDCVYFVIYCLVCFCWFALSLLFFVLNLLFICVWVVYVVSWFCEGWLCTPLRGCWA